MSPVGWIIVWLNAASPFSVFVNDDKMMFYPFESMTWPA